MNYELIYVCDAELASGGDPVEVYWDDRDNLFHICKGNQVHKCPARTLTRAVLLNDELENWLIDNDLYDEVP